MVSAEGLDPNKALKQIAYPTPSRAGSPVRFFPYGKPAKLPVRKLSVLQGQL
jgi:hypothetical protein